MKIKLFVGLALIVALILATGIIVEGLLLTHPQPIVTDTVIIATEPVIARKEDVYIPSAELERLLYEAKNNITYPPTIQEQTPVVTTQPAVTTPNDTVTSNTANQSAIGTPQNPIVISTTPTTTTTTSTKKKPRVTRAS